MTTPTIKDHWDRIYSDKEDVELGWHESDLTQTFKFLDQIPTKTEDTNIFIPGIGTSGIVEALIEKQYKRIILNDISDHALGKLKARLHSRENITWLNCDISKPITAKIPQIDIWLDRAVLHFLLKEEEIQGYFDNLHTLLNPGGHVLLAEFSLVGAEQCSGLDVHRYSSVEMSDRLGKEFHLVHQEDYTFINPRGVKRAYIYALFQKRR